MDLDSDLDIKMQSLTVNDILYQNTYQNTYENTYQDDNYTMDSSESSELTESESTISEHIIYDMQNLSVNEKEEFISDLFDNNLDIYSLYFNIKENVNYKIDQIEYNTDIDSFYNKYNILRIIGVPNIYCDGEDFDDEDFIYNRFKLSEHLSYLVQNDNTVQDIDTSIINFADNIISPENVYNKILYIYQFVHYFHTTLSTIPYKKRIMHLPQEFLLWTNNIVSIIRNTINITDMNTSLCVFKNTNHVELKNIGQYFKDLVYGMSLCICHLKMILNHHNVRKIPFWDMEIKYMEKFFRVLNNLCIIVIYMKHGF